MDEQQAIEAAREALCDDEVSVDHGDGHSGVGWYAWVTDYPEEGAVFLETA